MNVFAQVSYVEFEYYQCCVFLNDPLLCKFWYEEKKRMHCILELIERNEMIVLNNIIVWNIDKKDNQQILEPAFIFCTKSVVV